LTGDLSIILFLARVLSLAEPEEMDIRRRLGSFDLEAIRELKGWLILNKKIEEIKGINENLQAHGRRIEGLTSRDEERENKNFSGYERFGEAIKSIKF
jgi:hypothetical protein